MTRSLPVRPCVLANQGRALEFETRSTNSFQFLEGTWRARNLGLKTDFQSKKLLS
jgi:hypothetical protein